MGIIKIIKLSIGNFSGQHYAIQHSFCIEYDKYLFTSVIYIISTVLPQYNQGSLHNRLLYALRKYHGQHYKVKEQC